MSNPNRPALHRTGARPARRGAPRAVAAAAIAVGAAPAARAHDPSAGAPGDGAWTAWTADPWIAGLMGAALLVQAAAAAVLARRGGVSGRRRALRSLATLGGLAVAAAALLGPVDALGDRSLAAHTAQHMALLAVAAPLIAAGAPLAAAGAAIALARRDVPALARLSAPWRLSRRATAPIAQAGAATLLQAVVMWAWHLPMLVAAALASDLVHAAMHASFLVAGAAFWSALLRGVRGAQGFGAGALALAATLGHMGLLGALLFFSPRPLYADYALRVEVLGLDWRADQQLAGLVMWVPACVPYLAGGAWLLAAWLRRMEAAAAPAREAAP